MCIRRAFCFILTEIENWIETYRSLGRRKRSIIIGNYRRQNQQTHENC